MIRQKMNLAGSVLSRVLILTGLCVLVAFIMFPMFLTTGHTRLDRCKMNMQQIRMLILAHAKSRGHFPKKGWDSKNSCPIWFTEVRGNFAKEQWKIIEQRLKCPLTDTKGITSYDISTAVAGKPWDERFLRHRTPLFIEKPHPSGNRFVCYCGGSMKLIDAGEKYPE